MIFEPVHVGGDKNFGYLIVDEETREAVVVDPGADPGAMLARAKELDAEIVLVLATHSHYDHIAGVDMICRRRSCPFAGYKTIAGIDRPLDDGDVVTVGEGVTIRCIHCPGHCDDSLLLVCNEQKVIAGDEIFIGGVGITRSEEQARLHYTNLHGILMKLPDEMEVYVGHDYGAAPSSTIGEQRRTNPFLLQPDFESFWHLRQNWKAYCAERGIDWG